MNNSIMINYTSPLKFTNFLIAFYDYNIELMKTNLIEK